MVEPIFQRLYSFIFDVESDGFSATEMDRPAPAAIFVVNFDKVRMQFLVYSSEGLKKCLGMFFDSEFSQAKNV